MTRLVSIRGTTDAGRGPRGVTHPCEWHEAGLAYQSLQGRQQKEQTSFERTNGVLTLTRKIGQKIFIGNGIEIVVREIRGRQVRLGIQAPEGLPVFREELYDNLAASNRQAQSTLDEERATMLPEP